MPLNAGAREGLTLCVSQYECHVWTHMACLVMWVPRKDSQYVSLDAAGADALTLRVPQCGCHVWTHTACLVMWVP